MDFGANDVYLYLGDFLKKRIGENKITQDMLDKSINILSNYYFQIESHNLNNEDKNKHRLSAIDALLEVVGALKNNINRKSAAWEILPKYENEEEVKNFENWLCPSQDELSLIQKLNLMLYQIDKQLISEKKVRTLSNRIRFAKDIFKGDLYLRDLIIYLKNGYTEVNKEVVIEVRKLLLRQLNLIIYEEKFVKKTHFIKYGLEEIRQKIEELKNLIDREN